MIHTIRSLGVLSEPPDDAHAAVAAAVGIPCPTAADHAELFLFQLFPYASVHLGEEGMLGGDAYDRVSGFFSAIGGRPPNEADHLAVLLGAYADLLEREREVRDRARRSGWTQARRTLLAEHLLPWVPGLLARVRDLGGPAYQAWADLLDEVLAAEAAESPLTAGLLPAHLASARALPDPRDEGASAFIDGLLAPVRAGMIVTSADLSVAARQTSLGHRIGERRFVLRSLFEQDPVAVLEWAEGFAVESADRWRCHWLAGTATGTWWLERSISTAGLIRDLRVDAQEELSITT